MLNPAATAKIKAIVFAAIATPFLYGVGAAIIQATKISASFAAGKALFGISFSLAYAAGLFIFRTKTTPASTDNVAKNDAE